MLTSPKSTCYSTWPLARTWCELQTEPWKKEELKKIVPADSSLKDMVGFQGLLWRPTSFSVPLFVTHTHTHTHKHRHTHWHTNSLSHSPLQWVIGDVSEPDRYWVSLPRIEWQAKKPFGKEEKVRLWKCAPSWLLILSLTHSSGGPSFDHKQDSQVEIWIFLRKNSTFSGAEKNSLVRTHSWHNSVGFRKVVYEPRQSS